MKAATYHLIAAFLILSGLAAIGLSFHKQVTLTIGEEQYSLSTFALTPGQLLRLQNIKLAPQDLLTPPANHWIGDGEVINIRRAAAVTLDADGEIQHLSSVERMPANLLASAGVHLYPGDQVLLQGERINPETILPLSSAYALQVLRAVPMSFQEKPGRITQTLTASSLGQALWEAGIQARVADERNLALNTPILPGTGTGSSPVSLQDPAQAVTLQDGDRQIKIYTAATTVGAALAENGLAPAGLDYTIPNLNDPIPSNRQVRLVRVQERLAIEQTPLPYETKYEPADDLEIDNKKVIQAGQYGIKARRVRIRVEDGKEVSRQVEGEWIASQPQDQILGYGTLVTAHTLDTPDGPIQYWRAVTMWATSYHPSEVGSITASGARLEKGVVAVDPYLVPLGTQLYVPDYGMATAADTGGGVRGRWIDLGYSDDDYVSWHQWVTVYFLWPPPANIVWTIP